MIQVLRYGKSFGDRTILEDITIDFLSDRLYALVGESGSGKTTFLRNLSQLDTSYDGSFIVDGLSFEKLKRKEREKERTARFSYVFSDANLLEYLDLRENAELSSFLIGQEVDREREERLLDFLNLRPLERNDVTNLSAGEQQRVAILRALMTDRKYLICDEPTAHLDRENAKKIIELFHTIAHKLHKTVLIALHDFSNLSLFDEVYQIRKRKIVPYEEN